MAANPAENALNPKLAMDGAGNAIVVWLDQGKLRASRYAVDSGWSEASEISEPGATVRAYDLVISKPGGAVVVWDEKPTDDATIVLWSNQFE